MFRHLLIANCGEIASRVIRTCRTLGIASVAIYSDIDATELHVTEADHAQAIGPAPARDSYLKIGHVIDAASRSGAEAIHPGYGFLPENAEFSDACRHAEISCVGPSPAVIARAGTKIKARRLAESAGVPVVPGSTPDDQASARLRRAIGTASGSPPSSRPQPAAGKKVCEWC